MTGWLILGSLISWYAWGIYAMIQEIARFENQVTLGHLMFVIGFGWLAPLFVIFDWIKEWPKIVLWKKKEKNEI